MKTKEQVEKAVRHFIHAGDSNDIDLLEEVLHPQFQNIQDGFFEERGVFIFLKQDYKSLVKTKRFGGAARTIEFGSIEISGDIAEVKVKLESKVLVFYSTIVLCKVIDRWKVIHNIPKIMQK